MALVAYRNKKTNKELYVFDNEPNRLPSDIDQYEKMPPNPVVIRSTKIAMTDFPYLESLFTIDDVDKQKRREASEKREALGYHKAAIKI